MLKFATRFWFIVTMTSQLIFGVAVASFYGLTAMRGDYYRWSRFVTGGVVEGDRMGNLAVAMHVASAAVVMLAGALQLIPKLRSRFPRFHRWNGRMYMLTAITVSVAGVYMTYFRRTVGDMAQHVGSTLNAVLIWVCVGFALKTALQRNFGAHREWALRLFLVVSASFFLRLLFFPIAAIFGPVGFDPITFRGPMLTTLTYAQYIVPLLILELYFSAQKHGGFRRLAATGVLYACSAEMIVGTVILSMAIWVPDMKAGFDSRKSIAQTLGSTVKARGVEAAVAQYATLRTHKDYNLDEPELNTLGYQLLRNKQFDSAIRILQLNALTYPKSANVYDSLGEAYLNAGDKLRAIANYRRSLSLNPKNYGAVAALRKLGALASP